MLLINSVWGCEEQQEGLLLLQGRWVSPSEKQQLLNELKAYRAIRSVALLAFFTAVLLLIAISGNFATGEAGYGVLPLTVSLFLSLAMGFGLLRYRLWARLLATVSAVATILFILYLIGDFLTGLDQLSVDALLRPIYAPMIPLVVALLIPWLVLRSLHSRIANIIFTDPD